MNILLKSDYAKVVEEGGWVRFGEVARGEMGMQCQYGVRYLDGLLPGYPKLGEGLRVKVDIVNYHATRIHIDDVLEFLFRYHEYRRQEFGLTEEEYTRQHLQ